MASPISKVKLLFNELDNTSLRGTAALDQVVKTISKFSSWQSVIDTVVKDCTAYDGHYYEFLRDQCGIVLDNADIGAITGSDAGGSKIKTAETIVPESGDWTYPDSDTVNIDGLTVKFPKKSTLSEAQQWIVGALNTWWISGGLSLINSSFAMNFNEAGTTVSTLEVKFENSSNTSLLAYTSYDRKQKTSKLYITINMRKYRDIDLSDPNGYTSSAPIYLDRTIAHELTHAVMAANVDYFYQLPAIFTEGVAEMVHGIDDQRRALLIELAGNSSKLRSALSTTATSGISTTNYAAGYVLMRYLAKQAANERDPDVDVVYNADVDEEYTDTTVVSSALFSSDQKTLTVIGDLQSDIWLGGTNTVTGSVNEYGNAVTVTLDARRMTSSKILAGNANNNVIRAGLNGSTLWGGRFGNDTLYGGDGPDMFWYNDSDGNDCIREFTAGTSADSDVINFAGGSLGDITRSVSSVYFEKANGTLNAYVGSNVDEPVQYSFDAKNISAVKIGNTDWGNAFTFDSNTATYIGGNSDDTLKINDDKRHNIWLNIDEAYTSIEHIDASDATGTNILVGSFDKSVIIGGSGHSSLWGGSTDDDTLIGGDGAESFYYLHGNGNDVMQNVGSNDVVILLNINLDQFSTIGLDDKTLSFGFDDGNTLKATASGDDITFQLGDGSRWTFNHSSQNWRT